ncbi:MAG TPA: asparaginase [Labilithrix sp.]|nr:asparaginase [Labilithrix sp.]
MDLADCIPLFGLAREGVLEKLVHGFALFKHQDGPIVGAGADAPIVARSLGKPWQFLASGLGGPEAFWTLGFSSHSGQAQHVDHLRLLAAALRTGEEWISCPSAYPLDARRAWEMKLAGASPSRLLHPCSGKHLVWAGACSALGLPKDYLAPDHPLHARHRIILAERGVSPTWVKDGCGLPSAVMAGRDHLALWADLALDDSASARQLKRLWLEHPSLIGGDGRLDSDIVRLGNGELLAKQGADGLLVVQSLPPAGGTCLLKIAGGDNEAHAGLALVAMLSVLKDLPQPFAKLLENLRLRIGGWTGDDHALVLPPSPAIGTR